MNYSQEILNIAQNIKLAVFDVDGVLTNGSICISDSGEELKIFHVHDGLGIKLLQETGVAVAIISSRECAAVTHRMADIGVKHVYQGQKNKQIALEKLLTELQLNIAQVAYVGDDLPDLALIQRVGLGIAVPNAHPLLLHAATWQTKAMGGHGAAREVCELIMQAQGTLDAIYQKYL